MEELEKHISYSEILTYQECPRKHQYSYAERLTKISYSNSSRMNIGTVVHYILEFALKAYHSNNYELETEKLWPAIDGLMDEYIVQNQPQAQLVFNGESFEAGNLDEIKQWESDVWTATEIAKRTIQHLDIPNHWRTVELDTVPLVEYRFDYPIFRDRNLVGKIDWVAKSLDDGMIYLIDWKTRKIFVDDFETNGEDMNLQMSLYQYVLNSLGVDVFGTITYQIRSTIPSIPEITKSGKVSKAKLSTDWATYSQAVLANGESLDDYRDMEEKMPSDDYWWLPVLVIHGERELFKRWENTQHIVARMVADELAPKYETQRCAYCPFFRLCLAEDRGLDLDATKNVYYTIRENKIVEETNGEGSVQQV